MTPLSLILRKVKAGDEIKGRQKMIHHLLYIDDLKVYGKDEAQIDSLVKMVHMVSKGKVSECHGIVLPNGEVMKGIEQN